MVRDDYRAPTPTRGSLPWHAARLVVSVWTTGLPRILGRWLFTLVYHTTAASVSLFGSLFLYRLLPHCHATPPRGRSPDCAGPAPFLLSQRSLVVELPFPTFTLPPYLTRRLRRVDHPPTCWLEPAHGQTDGLPRWFFSYWLPGRPPFADAWWAPTTPFSVGATGRRTYHSPQRTTPRDGRTGYRTIRRFRSLTCHGQVLDV